MAVIPSRMSLTLVDANGVKSAVTLYVGVTDSQTVAQAVTELQAVAALVDAVTLAKVLDIRASIVPNYTQTKGGTNPDPDSDLTQTAVLDFLAANNRTWGMPLPAYLDSLAMSGGLDTTSANLAALIGHIEGSAAPYQYTDPGHSNISEFTDSFLTSRKRRKLRSRSYRPA